MITDVFLKRYPHLRVGDLVLPAYMKLFRQVTTIVAEDIGGQLHDDQTSFDYFNIVERTLRRELGRPVGPHRDSQQVLLNALYEPFDVWNDFHGTQEEYVATRLSHRRIALSRV